MGTIPIRPARRAAALAAVILMGAAACDQGGESKRATPTTERRDVAADAVAPATANALESTAAAEPAVDDMKWAVQESAKIGVPVDVRYEVSGTPLEDQPTTLNLALIPTIDGTRMRATFIANDSLSIEAGGAELAVDKSEQAAVYRRRMTVTPRQAGDARLRVQVIMDHDGGRYVGLFTVPVSSRSSAAAAPGGPGENRSP
jgi:hypothetical protein